MKILTRIQNKVLIIFIIAATLLSCKSKYQISKMSATIVAMDSTLDSSPNLPMQLLVNTYKVDLDKEMNVVIGESEEYMTYKRPESLLTNLTSDVMKAYGDEFLENGADLAIMNVHGHRAAMPKGKLTIGNLYEIYSFDNAITFLELKGSDLKKIFDAYAIIGGAGISGNVRLTIKNKMLVDVTIDGKPLDENKLYKIVTLDYLAEGNDNMQAMKDADKRLNTGITLRDIMIDYISEQTKIGNKISSKLDGRITIQD
ncbi:MAG: 5'-nucleotidase C-terminal domain-containing protein [Dysgonamonadaceae bacterium]